jgi:hypothetical protein
LKGEKMNNIKVILSATFILFVLFGCSENNQVPHSLSRNEISSNEILETPIDESLKTRVLILATPHLGSLGKSFKPSMLDSLLFVLEKFKPDLIGIESIPPSLIEDMERKKKNYAEVLNQFAKNIIDYGHKARELLSVSRINAEQKAASLLHELSAKPENEDIDIVRLNSVINLLASYDLYSALLQWSYIPENSRMNNQVIPEDIAVFLDEQLKQPNEITSIGISLARKLRLQRIESIDDHQDKDLFMTIAPKLMNEIKDNPLYKSIAESSFFIDSARQLKEAVQKGNLLPYYLYMNSSQYTSTDVKTQWHLFFRTHLSSGLDRSRAALWEVRNLNIASHIRRATALHPGKKMLVIIGASHKTFLDAYLSKMMDIKIIQLDDFISGNKE